MKRGTVRIIAGKWRGRKIPIADVLHLRPTPDRVRETVFNWLQPIIVGASCLDLFAGSGALGLEALSRGAEKVVFVDQSGVVTESLRQIIDGLNVANAVILQGSAPQILTKIEAPFDVVFLDPPFQANLLTESCFYLEENQFLAEMAYIYLESAEALTETNLPPNWQLLKQKKAGLVHYHLAKRTALT